MPKRTSYTEGTPCWVDLQTTDQDAAKTFYGGLFQWSFEDQEMGGGAVYSLGSINGERTAAIAPQSDDIRAQAVPPMWNTYVAVDDVDAAAKRAESAGGTVLMAPFDVMDSGRMAFVLDPTSAAVGLWQAGAHIGATIVNEPGAIIWNELQTDDEPAAIAFYREVVGLEPSPVEMDGQQYTTLLAGKDMVGGMTAPSMPGVPNHWHVYFSVADVAQSAAQAVELGAQILAGPFEASIGKMAVTKDPQGAVFTLFEAKAG